ncbi:ABC transporter permease [Ulvibacterium sp.]|uniref:ABC transporter permease n=1 Tax=Ulvibacterium sp. TaxID=2665914 RepID=UPI003BA9C535
MRSLLLIHLKYLVKRKREFLLVGFSLVLTILLLSIALSLLRIIGQPFDITFTNLKASEILLLFDNRNDDKDKITQWFSKQDEVLGASAPSPYIMVNAPLIHGEREIDLSVQLTEHNTGHLTQDQTRILKGASREHPDHGEIWLPSHFERSFDLQLGDTLGLSINGALQQLRISAFVVDPHYLSAIFNPTRAWVAPGELPFLAPLSELNNNMMGIRLKDKNQLDAFWKRFNENFEYSGKSLQYPLFKRAFTSFYTLLSSVLMIFSVMGLLISLLIINHTISSHVFSDYKQIGVLKGVGFTPGNMVTLYLMQMSFLALLALPLGLFVSWFVVRAVVNWITEPMGIPDFTYDLTTPVLVSFGITLFLIFAVSFFSARKAGLVKPVEAIRNSFQRKGGRSRKASKAFSSLWLPLSLLLGGRFLNSQRRNLVLMGINMAGIVFVVIFCVNIANSFDKIHTDRTAWGFDKADVVVNRNSSVVLALKHGQLMEMLRKYNNKIRTITPYNYTNLFLLSQDNKAVKEIQGKVYSGTISKTGLENIIGNHPVSDDEISLCIGTAQEFGKQIGDEVAVFIEGQNKVFTITGIYQDVGNFGQGFRLQEEALLALNPLFEPRFYGLELYPNVERDEFRLRLENQFGETIRTELGVEERKSMVSMVMNIRIAVFTISLFFVLVLVLIIYNDQNIYIQQNKISFVKLKSLGFTVKNLRMILLWKTLLNLVLGMSIGIPLSLWLGPKIMNILTADIGLVRFPFIPSPIGMIVSIVVLFVLGALSVWFAAAALRKLNFRIISNL